MPGTTRDHGDVLNGPLVELDLGVIPSPSGPCALVLHGEENSDCLVVMHVHRPADPAAELAAVVTFHSCEQSTFGYPNDEAYWAVEGAGYGFYEVPDSDWDLRLREFNLQRFPHPHPSAYRLRHYFMGCHDASGQFLAVGLTIEVVPEGYTAALRRALRQLGAEP